MLRKTIRTIFCIFILPACSKTQDSQPIATSPLVAVLNCSSVSYTASATANIAYTATATLPYAGGNGIKYSIGNPIHSTGVTGLTATLQAGALTSGNGQLSYSISGTPKNAGTAVFSINFGGKTCSINLTVAPNNYVFAKGADIGWLDQMEKTGYIFYDTDGTQKDCLQLLKDRGMNSVRLRVWVNPSDDKTNGHCSKAETVAMAVRAKNMGMRVMIDFHYSDSWADPGKQNKPAAWATHSFTQLLDDVYNHTYDVLNDLKTAGVTPAWVQIGNEIPGGMLWPDGSSSNFSQLVQLINKGYDATKAISSSIKVVVHIDQGNDNSKFRWFFDNATANGVKFDVIGASYYPYWLNSNYTATINNLQVNLNDMVTRYGKEVMVVEVGGDYTLVQNTYDMLTAVINIVRNIPNSKGLGVMYWEPEGEKSWSGYQLNCWQSDGKPSLALDAFKN